MLMCFVNGSLVVNLVLFMKQVFSDTWNDEASVLPLCKEY
jgi:hypothetical protein